MTTGAADYLGRHIDDLLTAEPFSGWHAVRSVETEPWPETRYAFKGHGVDLICDRHDRIQTAFLRRGDAESLVDVPFALSRAQVLERFGPPDKSGPATRHPAIGDNGPWDRFSRPEGFLHIQYGVERDEIHMITLMLSH